MTATDSSARRGLLAPEHAVSVSRSLVAPVLLLASGSLQLVASLERWAMTNESGTRDVVLEDHRFDYSYPSDPWENVGSAAQLFGVGSLLLALGILALAGAVGGKRRRLELMLAAVVAVGFGLNGAHALASGLTGAPSPVQSWPLQWLLSVAGAVGLVVLGCLWRRRKPAAAVACAFLLGATVPGYLVAAFAIAPAITGYQSHDTTPWTETIVAATTIAAGLAMLLAAGLTARARSRAARSASTDATHPADLPV